MALDKPWRALATVVLTLLYGGFLAAPLVLLVKEASLHREIDAFLGVEDSFVLHRAQIEADRATILLQQTLYGDPAAHSDRVRTAFDVLYGRREALINVGRRTALGSLPAFDGAIASMAAVIDQADRLLEAHDGDGLPAEPVSALLDRIDALHGHLATLSGQAVAAGAMARDEIRARTASLNEQVDASLLALLLASPIYVGGLVATNLRLRRAARRMAALASELGSKNVELIRARDEAEAAGRAKTNFLANMSHELRTPLNAVIGFADVMDQEMFGPLGNDRYREYAGDICGSARHLLGLIGRILDFAKIDGGHWQLEERAERPAEIVDTALRMVRPLAEARRLRLTRTDGVDALFVRLDERAIMQAVVNLLSNAIKFSHDGGRIDVTLARNGLGGLDIRVADHGIGMTEADVARVVLPFTQVGDSFARAKEGIGLGLAITRALVDLHGGELLIESAPAVGTAVTIRLPAERIETAETRRGAARRDGARRQLA
ncbi:MAG: HAMP domain-containing sensor histidine kinase [Alphaproteobacteria bacterium]